MPSAFVDTNVLIYSIDDREAKRRKTAITLLAEIGENLTTSTQVLQEFYWNATRKVHASPATALGLVQHLTSGRVVQITPRLIVEAIDTSESYRISFWDALIVEAAAVGGCAVLYTEDLNHGQRIRGVRIHNPFL